MMKLTLENLQAKVTESEGQVRCGNGAERHQLTSGGDGWILPPPQISEWNTTSPHSADEAGLIQEHPRNIGTPTPAMLTATSLIRAVQSFTAGLLILLAVNLDSAMLPAAGAGLALSMLLLTIEYFSRRKTCEYRPCNVNNAGPTDGRSGGFWPTSTQFTRLVARSSLR